MKQTWNDYEKAAERGPVAIAVKVTVALLVFGVALSIVGHVLGFFGESATVAREEFGPRAMLEKYESGADHSGGIKSAQHYLLGILNPVPAPLIQIHVEITSYTE